MSTHAQRALARLNEITCERRGFGLDWMDVEGMQINIDILTAIEQTRDNGPSEDPQVDPVQEAIWAVQAAKEIAVRHKQFQLASELRLFERALTCEYPIPEEEQPKREAVYDDNGNPSATMVTHPNGSVTFGPLPERKVPQPLTQGEVDIVGWPQMDIDFLRGLGLGIYRIKDVEEACK